MPADSGSIEVLEFSWPLPAPDLDTLACSAYVLMRRPQGFLLCIPEGFLAPEELEQGQQATAAEGIGPSLALEAPR